MGGEGGTALKNVQRKEYTVCKKPKNCLKVKETVRLMAEAEKMKNFPASGFSMGKLYLMLWSL